MLITLLKIPFSNCPPTFKTDRKSLFFQHTRHKMPYSRQKAFSCSQYCFWTASNCSNSGKQFNWKSWTSEINEVWRANYV